MPPCRPPAVLLLLVALAAPAPGEPDPAKYREHALTAKGDPKRGKALCADARTRCSVCHKVNGTGGEVGPDLSAVGGKFDRQHLIESVLEPSAQIVEGYRTTVIATADGRTLTGVVRGEAGGRLTLFDIDGKKHTIAADEIES